MWSIQFCVKNWSYIKQKTFQYSVWLTALGIQIQCFWLLKVKLKNYVAGYWRKLNKEGSATIEISGLLVLFSHLLYFFLNVIYILFIIAALVPVFEHLRLFNCLSLTIDLRWIEWTKYNSKQMLLNTFCLHSFSNCLICCLKSSSAFFQFSFLPNQTSPHIVR